MSPERRVTLFYFFQSMSVGAANAFAGIWFASKELSEQQIGIISAAPVMVLLTIGLTVGRIADKADDWRQVIVAGAIASALFPFGLFAVDGFWGILLFWTLAVASQWMVITVADAAAMRMSQRRGSSFGVFRAWGTIGYLLVILAAGFVLSGFGGAWFLPLFVGLCVLRAVSSLALPKFRAEGDDTGPDHVDRPRRASRLWTALTPRFLLILGGWAIVYATHLVLHGFMGLLWQRQGLSPDVIGFLIALSGVAEAAMFFAFKSVAVRFTTRTLILASCVAAIIRWIGLSFAPGVEWLVALQLLHAVSYALGFLACMTYITEQTSDDIAAQAQSFFVIMQQASGILAFLLFGALAGALGTQAYLASAVIAALGLSLVWVGGWKRFRKIPMA